MKIIYKAPGRSAEVRDVPNTLEALQGLVGGSSLSNAPAAPE